MHDEGVGELAWEWKSSCVSRLLVGGWLGPDGSESRDNGLGKKSLPVAFRSLAEVEESWWENGGPNGIAGYSEAFGLITRFQPVEKHMGEVALTVMVQAPPG